MNRDTIYIDTEDDITAIISKLNDSAARIVALVPPKRSSVLSSVVNLKLLNKAAEDGGKRVVLITQDKTLTALAGGIGMYVAENLKSPPVIPMVDKAKLDLPSEVIEDTRGLSDTDEAPEDEMVDDAEAPSQSDKDAPVVAAKPAVKPKVKAAKSDSKKLKVPNFNTFKKKLLISAGLLLLLGLAWWQAFYILPKAVIALEASTARLETEVEMTLDEKAEEVDTEKNILPATSEMLEKNVTESFDSTGEQNQGDKATGKLTIENCYTNKDFSFISGTAFVASSGHVFFSTEAVTVPGADFAGGCSKPGTASVSVIAENPGTNHNINSTSYSIRSLSTSINKDFTVTGSKMSSGTDKIIKIVTQADVDKAIGRAQEAAKGEAIPEIKKRFDDDIVPIEITYSSQAGEPVTTPAVGSESPKGEVTIKVTHTMRGVDEDDINKLLAKVHKEKVPKGQVIVDNGLAKAKFEKLETPEERYLVKTTAFTGPDVDEKQLAKRLAGKGFSEAIKESKAIPGVSDAKVKSQSFWIFSLPSRAENITIELQVDEGQK